jgi:hypothetical protein
MRRESSATPGYFGKHSGKGADNRGQGTISPCRSGLSVISAPSTAEQVVPADRFAQDRWFLKHFLWRDIHFWWWLTRFDARPLDSPLGAWLNRLADGKGRRVLDTGIYRAALAAGTPNQRAMFARFTDTGVVWDDGSVEDVDSVIFATGYRPNLSYLAPLGALDVEGRALHRHGVSLTVPGLYFMGLSNQRTFSSATLRGVGSDAAVVVRHLTRQLAPATRALIPARLRLAATQICCPAR